MTNRDPVFWDESGRWFPLRRDGCWLTEDGWQRPLRVLSDRQRGLRALAALRAVFEANWSRQQEGMQDLHPVVFDALMIEGRHRLLEIGDALDGIERRKRFRERLLLNHEYDGACAELRVGAWLRGAGATVCSEPVKDGRGPDWLAEWPGESLAVEVKCPRTSASERQRQRILTEFWFALSEALVDQPLEADTGLWLTLHLSQAVLGARTALGAPDLHRVRSLAAEMAGVVYQTMRDRPTTGQFPAGVAGYFALKSGAGAEPRVHILIEAPAIDAAYGSLRVAEIVQGAADQLNRVSRAPGLIVIDARADLSLLNQQATIHEQLQVESWARKLVGVAILTQTSTHDDVLLDSRVDTVLHLVPGRRLGELPLALLSAFRVCERSHLHIDFCLLPPAHTCGAL